MRWLAVLALAPLAFPSQSWVNIATLTAFSAFLGQSWNIAGGFGGLTSFGHAAFFGIGAYAAALVSTRTGWSPWLGFPVAAMLGAAAAAVIGWASFRAGLRGSYFALVTLAFAEAFRVIANSAGFTQGGLGINIAFHPGATALQFQDRRGWYALVLALLALATASAAWLRRGRFGARLAALRENEDAARALGVDIVRTKTAALALSGGLTAMGGVIYAQTYLYVDPAIAFGSGRSVEMLLVCMIGGPGTVWGPVLGALLLHAASDTARVWIDAPGLAPMLYGVVLLVAVGLRTRFSHV